MALLLLAQSWLRRPKMPWWKKWSLEELCSSVLPSKTPRFLAEHFNLRCHFVACGWCFEKLVMFLSHSLTPDKISLRGFHMLDTKVGPWQEWSRDKAHMWISAFWSPCYRCIVVTSMTVNIVIPYYIWLGLYSLQRLSQTLSALIPAAGILNSKDSTKRLSNAYQSCLT